LTSSELWILDVSEEKRQKAQKTGVYLLYRKVFVENWRYRAGLLVDQKKRL